MCYVNLVSYLLYYYCSNAKYTMCSLQEINDLGEKDVKKMLDSIDYVFLDIDGVLFHNKTPIPGAKEGVEKLRKLGKKIAFVSNNTIYTLNMLLGSLKLFGATKDEIVTPNMALLAYLKKIDFKKDIFVTSCSLPKKLLKEAGYKVIEYKDIYNTDLEETISGQEKLSLKTLEVCKNVGAVLVDLDFNLHLGSIQATQIILNHIEDVLFLTGVQDDIGNITDKMKFILSRFYIDGLERWTETESITMAKPGTALKVILSSKFNITDDSRVLFLGDNVYTDIAFGVNSGYQTCLFLSGVTTKEQVENWAFPEKFKPTFVTESFNDFYEKIKDL